MDFARPDVVEAFLHLNVYQELQEFGLAGATVCVTKAGRYSISIANCYGFLDSSQGLVLDANSSLFDLGGCAKVLTGLAVLRVLQDHGLTVAAEVNSLLPPDVQVDTSRYGSVTLQHLLTHTSGLQRGGACTDTGTGTGGGGGADAAGVGSAQRAEAAAGDLPATPVMAYLKAQPVFGAKLPGVFRPQDVDYMLLGAILEQLTGRPFHTYIQETFLDPLGVRLPSSSRTAGLAATTANGSSAGSSRADAEDVQQAGSLVHAYRAGGAMQPAAGAVAAAAAAAPAPAGLAEGPPSVASGAGTDSGPAAVLEDTPLLATGLGPPAAPTQRVLLRYPPGPLTPVGGLVLTARGISRLLPLFVHGVSSAASAADDDEGQGQGGAAAAAGRKLLSTLCEVRITDFLKDIGVAYGGLCSLGLSHCGDRVLACESPPPPPSTREQVLVNQAAQQGAQQQQESQQQQQQGPDADAQAAEPAAAPPDSGAGEAGGNGGPDNGGLQGSGHHPALLLLAPDSSFAMVICCNTAGKDGAAFCRKIASKLLQQYRPSELPRSSVRSWLVPLPPPRQDAITQLVAFPPACCVSPTAYFDGWPLLLPDYIRVHCMQAPGHGLRLGEPCEFRLPKLVPPAAAAILASVSTDTPLALYGHGLGALWAFEVARRLECLYQRQVLHLFVCACAAPACVGASGGVTRAVPGSRAGGGTGAPAAAGGGEGGSGSGGVGVGVGGADEGGVSPRGAALPTRFDPWRDLQRESGAEQPGDATELYELPDEAFVTACRNHPRCPRQLRSNTKQIVENMAALRADIEAETRYHFAPAGPSLCASVAAALATVQNRADEEARLSQGLLSCPITVLTPEEDTSLSTALTAGWEQVTEGQVRFQTVPGDYHCLEDRKHRAQLVAAITNAMGRQMSVHVPWLAKMRPAGAGGRWGGGSGSNSSRPSGSARPGSAASGLGPGPGSTPHLPPMYPRG